MNNVTLCYPACFPRGKLCHAKASGLGIQSTEQISCRGTIKLMWEILVVAVTRHYMRCDDMLGAS